MQDKVFIERYNFQHPDKVCKCQNFTFSATDKDYSNCLTIKENENWYLVFEGNSKDKLYIDGLNLIDNSDNEIKTDENDQRYISPGFNLSVRIKLYTPSNSDKEYAGGFLPGKFLLKLVLENQVPKYSWLQVNPKYLKNDELDIMKKEVEKSIQGLARDYRAGYSGSTFSIYQYLTMDDLETLSILHVEKETFLNVYQRIIYSPKSKINLTYKWEKNKSILIDQVSIKEMMSHPEKRNQVFGKTRNIMFNTSENLDLKNNLLFLKKRIRILINHVDQEINNTQFKAPIINNLVNDKKIVELYFNLINYLLNQEWMKSISVKYSLSNNVQIMDQRYLFFNKLVWQINHITYHKSKFHRQYDYYWKRTELLYEIWSYVKVIKAMNNIGFKATSGWIFNTKAGEDFPILPDGTIVNMVFTDKLQSTLFAKVIYNKKISATSQDNVEQNDPIWCTSNHNKPDIRINLYDEKKTLVYLIVMDSKYRRLQECNYGKTWEQINSYSNSMYSEFPLCSKQYRHLKGTHITNISDLSIDTSTFILYPKIKDEKISRLEDKRIQAIGLKPDLHTNNSKDDLEDKLAKRLNSVQAWISKNAKYE